MGKFPTLFFFFSLVERRVRSVLLPSLVSLSFLFMFYFRAIMRRPHLQQPRCQPHPHQAWEGAGAEAASRVLREREFFFPLSSERQKERKLPSRVPRLFRLSLSLSRRAGVASPYSSFSVLCTKSLILPSFAGARKGEKAREREITSAGKGLSLLGSSWDFFSFRETPDSHASICISNRKSNLSRRVTSAIPSFSLTATKITYRVQSGARERRGGS